MAVPLLCLALFLAMTHLSSGTYCLCNTGLSDLVLQRNIDYSCGAGADCTPISQNGACYNPNTVKDHCNYAVNSYYQRNGQTPSACNFTGSASTSQTVPAQASGCVYPSNAGNNTTPTPPSTPSTTPPGSTTPTPPSTPSTTPPGSTTPTPSPFAISPPTPGSGGINTDGSAATLTAILQTTHLFYSFTLTLLLPCLMFWRV